MLNYELSKKTVEQGTSERIIYPAFGLHTGVVKGMVWEENNLGSPCFKITILGDDGANYVSELSLRKFKTSSGEWVEDQQVMKTYIEEVNGKDQKVTKEWSALNWHVDKFITPVIRHFSNTLGLDFEEWTNIDFTPNPMATYRENITDYFTELSKVIPEEFSKGIEVDFFAQYQWPGRNATRDYVVLADNMFSGTIIHPKVETKSPWEAIRESYRMKDGKIGTKLYYKNKEGDIHPIKRDDYFLNSKNGKPNFTKESDTNNPMAENSDMLNSFLGS